MILVPPEPPQTRRTFLSSFNAISGVMLLTGPKNYLLELQIINFLHK